MEKIIIVAVAFIAISIIILLLINVCLLKSKLSKAYKMIVENDRQTEEKDSQIIKMHEEQKKFEKEMELSSYNFMFFKVFILENNLIDTLKVHIEKLNTKDLENSLSQYNFFDRRKKIFNAITEKSPQRERKTNAAPPETTY